jgi:hypothetical protein
MRIRAIVEAAACDRTDRRFFADGPPMLTLCVRLIKGGDDLEAPSRPPACRARNPTDPGDMYAKVGSLDRPLRRGPALLTAPGRSALSGG